MGKYQPLAISYANEGLVKNKNAFVLSDDAFQDLDNALVWRGRIKRKPGYEKLGQLQRNFSSSGYVIPASGVTGNLYTIAGVTAETNARIIPLTFSATTDASNKIEDLDGTGTLTAAGTYTSGTINYLTGEINLVYSAAPAPTTAFSYAPCLPVMGLRTRELDDVNSEQLVAFDTKYSYQFNGTNNRFTELPQTTPLTWTGTDSEFFYTTNYWRDDGGDKIFWATNFKKEDPIRYYSTLVNDWSQGATIFEPYLDNATTVETPTNHEKLYQAKLLIPYKGRLVALNTWEGPNFLTRDGATQNPQRARWSQNGTPIDPGAVADPLLNNAWRSDVAGRGGFIDCSTTENIVAAEFIRDLLVVSFERSTWALRYTGNEILPFVWERINKELGADSTFSMVPFDQGILYVGDKTINSCNGTSVERIDEEIPDEVFSIHNGNDGPIRVHGIRDFYDRLVYWTFPDANVDSTGDGDPTFPNRILVFNYHTGAWGVFRDSFTTLGVYQQSDDRTWADYAGVPWSEANFAWNDPSLQSDFPEIVGGNQQGYVLRFTQIRQAIVGNSPSLHIGAMGAGTPGTLTVINHNLEQDDYIKLTGLTGANLPMNGALFKVNDITDADTIALEGPIILTITGISKATSAIITVGNGLNVGDLVHIHGVVGMEEMNGVVTTVTAADETTITIPINSTEFTTYTSSGGVSNLALPNRAPTIASGYTGGGEISRVSNFNIRSKKFNQIQSGKKNFLGHIDFLAETTTNGEISCEIYTDYNDTQPINTGADSFFNTKFLTQATQFSQKNKTKEWHRFYCTVDAQFFEFNLTLDDDQMRNPLISEGANVQIDAFIIWSERGSRIVD